jgi:hypothetical protein
MTIIERFLFYLLVIVSIPISWYSPEPMEKNIVNSKDMCEPKVVIVEADNNLAGSVITAATGAVVKEVFDKSVSVRKAKRAFKITLSI